MSLEHVLEEYLLDKNLLNKDLKISSGLKDAIVELSDAFTKDRSFLRQNYFASEKPLGAYIAGFMLTNATKVKRCLKQHEAVLPSADRMRVIDLGCGPGTAVFAVSEFLKTHRPQTDVHFTAVELSGAALDVAGTLAKDILPDNHSVDWIQGDFTSFKKLIGDDGYDLGVMTNALSELKTDKDRLKTIESVLGVSEMAVIVEPALRETTRGLMSLRDELLDEGLATVLAPCAHQRRCPMLEANDRDWCHFYIEWQRPRLVEAVDIATGLDHRYLKMAYMIISQAINPVRGSQFAALGGCRIVSSPLKSKGKIEIVVCGNEGELKRIRRLDKNKSQTNKDFDEVKRGDLVQFTDKERPGDVRALDNFTIIKRFN